MGFFSRMFQTKDAANTIRTAALADLMQGWFGMTTKAGANITTQTALLVPVVLCGARVIAEGVAQLPVVVKRGKIVGDRMYFSPAYDHWSWLLLRKRPNAWMTSFEFREALTIHAVLNGNGYAYIVRGLNDEVTELIPISSDMCKPEQLSDYTVQYQIRDGKRLLGTVKASDILHIHGPSWDMISGINIVRQAAEAIGLATVLQNQQSTLAGNGGRPSGVLSSSQALGKEAQDSLKKSWLERFGPGGEGGVAILDGDWKYNSLTMSGVDQQHIETREHQIAEVARALRVFPQMLMSAVDKTTTYGSAEQFFIAHVKHSLGPWIERWEQAIERDILRDDTLECEFDTTWLESGTMVDRGEFYAKAQGSGGTKGWLTANDIRAREGYNPHEDGDTLPQPTAAPAPTVDPTVKMLMEGMSEANNRPINIDARTNVHPAEVKVDVGAPQVKVDAPNIEVHPPAINVEGPRIEVVLPDQKALRKITDGIEHDAKGRITKFVTQEVEE